ncbi:MAG: hypothetical protein DSM107014_08475 [Gomphosphaeria aponina SAG 52.96 = DSM 107014]|uniref:Uncharacterized protein n=1 Tax=Gomphosphaeria aponina SAG 52.96 = DSM 107014 TaxID=1521640 RepID=A0A941JPQ6_9CHRO|nr:hypothetical protein [Gomphosphaeria aponina SAG 52.96 = DSM 107014]
MKNTCVKFRKQRATALIVAIFTIFSFGGISTIQANPVTQKILLSQINWETKISEAGKFNVVLPEGERETRTQSMAIAGQSVDWEVLKVKTESGVYSVSYTDLTPEIIELGANAVIDSIKDTLVNEFNWSAIQGRGRVISVQGYPGREIVGSKNDRVSVLRLILADQRLYAVMSTADNLGNIGKFFESFAVNPWQPYIFEEGGFQVNLPLSPSNGTNSVKLAGKMFDWQVIESHNLTAPEDSYAVGYTDVSQEDLKNGANALIQSVGESLMEQLQLKTIIDNGRKISLGENEGLAFVGINEAGQIVGVHFYLVGQRLYGVSAISDDLINISKFINSFQIQ